MKHTFPSDQLQMFAASVACIAISCSNHSGRVTSPNDAVDNPAASTPPAVYAARNERKCSWGTFDSKAKPITMSKLFQKSDELIEKRIVTAAFIVIEGEDRLLLASRWDTWFGIREISFLYPDGPGDKLSVCNRKDVEVEGIFSKDRSRAGMIGYMADGVLTIQAIREIKSDEKFKMPKDLLQDCTSPSCKEMDDFGAQVPK